MRQASQWSEVYHDPELQLDTLHARFTTHAFVRHWHDYYVIGLVEEGAQSFWCRRDTHTTPRGGLIALNPGEAHTGEAAITSGFTYRAIYPTIAHMRSVMAELGRPDDLPSFPAVRINDPQLAQQMRRVASAAAVSHGPLARQAEWLILLTQLVLRFADTPPQQSSVGAEPRAIARARSLLEEQYAERITLPMLAAQAGLSPYHLIRVFTRATGITPHAYLESIRIRHAQRLLGQGALPAHVAYDTGFSSQSHFTSRFRQIMGITPLRYQQAVFRS